MKFLFLFCIFGFTAVCGSGCCWVFTGPSSFDGHKQVISFVSNDGSEYEIMRKGMFGKPQMVGKTGMKIPIKKTSSYLYVKNVKTGKVDIIYPERDTNGVIWFNLFFPPAFVLDWATQSYRKFPDTIYVGEKK